jgi:monoamine oxidase
VGLAGGAGTMFATMGAMGLAPTAEAQAAVRDFQAPSKGDFTLTGRNAPSVVILGGGIAGLVSAYELLKGGYNVTVIEPRARTGGRNFTVRGGDSQTDTFGQTQTAQFSDGQYMNAGPARLAQWMITLDYCRELGVPVEAFTNQNANAFLYNSATMSGAERYRTAKADVYGYVSELLIKATSQGALDDTLTADDKARIISFLQSWGAVSRTTGLYSGGPNRGYTTYPAGPGVPGALLGDVPSLADVFASGVGRYFSFEFEYDMAMMMFQPVGGMDQIPRALTKAIGPQNILLGAQATGIVDNGPDVTVSYTAPNGQARTATADFVIAACPPWYTAAMTGNIPADAITALAAIRPSYASKIGLEYKSRWWETDLRQFGGITETDLDLAHIWMPSYGYLGERGVVIGYYNTGSNATKYGQMTPADREARALQLGTQIYGEKYTSEFATSFSQSWQYIPHLEAAWHGGVSPDSATMKPLVQPAGRIYYAGDWLSYEDAWQHGAISSARQVVTNINTRVLSG